MQIVLTLLLISLIHENSSLHRLEQFTTTVGLDFLLRFGLGWDVINGEHTHHIGPAFSFFVIQKQH